MNKLSPPEQMTWSGNVAVLWRKWRQRFELYLLATGANAKDEDVKVAIFLHVAGEKVLEIYNTLTFAAPAEAKKLDKVLMQFDAYCTPRDTEVIERFKFRQRKQVQGEPIDSFINDLKNIAQRCNFGTQEESLIRDGIIFGVIDVRLQERLLRECGLTLKKAMELCHAAEQTINQLQAINAKADTTGVVEIDAIRKKKFVKRFTKVKETPTSRTVPSSCWKCGTQHAIRQCLAFEKTCNSCKKRGHFAKMCRTKSSKIASVDCQQKKRHDVEYDVDTFFMGEINTGEPNKLWHAYITMNSKRVQFKLDTGAEVSMISLQLYNELDNKPAIMETKCRLRTFCNYVIAPYGKCSMTFSSGNLTAQADVFVVHKDIIPILGGDLCMRLGLVQRSDSPASLEIDSVSSTKDFDVPKIIRDDVVLHKHLDRFKDLGRTRRKYKIKLKENSVPVVHARRLVPVSVRDRMKKKLDEMVALGVIRKLQINEPTEWVNSITAVEKEDGSLKLCIDAPELNHVMLREHHLIPTLDEITMHFDGMKIFTTLDEIYGYWHILLDDESSRLCTFNTPWGRYCFLVLPFGIALASKVFQRWNEENFGDIPGIKNISDDMIIASRNNEEHSATLELVMQAARANNVKFNTKKIQLRQNQIKYLGHIITSSGVKPDPDKIKAINEMPDPTNQQEVHCVVGFINYLASFIPNAATILEPLRKLLRKNVTWEWNEEQRCAIQTIKEILSSQPVLGYFNPKKIIVQSDASQYGLGAVLLQDGHPIIYAARTMTSIEQRYAQIKKELLALQFAVTRFHRYIYGFAFTAHTDHKPLLGILKKGIDKLSPRLQRLRLKLQRYTFTLEYVPGKKLNIPDTLSRIVKRDNYDQCSEQTLNEKELELAVHAISNSLLMTPKKKEQYRIAFKSDQEMAQLTQYILEGWPTEKKHMRNSTAKYWNIRDKLFLANDCIMYNGQLVIPESMRREVLERLHEGLIGITKTLKKARQTIFWHGMSRDICISIIQLMHDMLK